jgi:hypothetical protein
MSALSPKELRECWIANAQRLDRLGHFARYSPKQRAEVLRKGYLGLWAPDPGIKGPRRNNFSATDVAQTLSLPRPDSSGRALEQARQASR